MSNADVVKIDVGKVISDRLPVLSRFMPGRLIKWLEGLIRQTELNGLLEANAGKTGAEFCRGVLKYLGITIKVRFPERLPSRENRRVLFVSNHPLGGLDGMALIDMIHRYYGGQVWFVVNDLLMAVKPLENVFLPINKFGSQQRQSAVRIEEAFEGNDPVIIFPAGLVSRYRRFPFEGEEKKMVADLEWRKTFVNKCIRYKRDIVPLFFSGTNSMDFYRKANLRKRLGIRFNLEMILLPREMLDTKGKTFVVTVGNIHRWDTLEGGRDAQGSANSLAYETYLLSLESGDVHDLPPVEDTSL